MARGKKIRIGTNIAKVTEKMLHSIKGDLVGAKRWEQYTTEGNYAFKYWLELVIPYVDQIKADPELSPEQKMVATKEFFRLFKENIHNFLATIVYEAKKRAKETMVASAKEAGAFPLIWV